MHDPHGGGVVVAIPQRPGIDSLRAGCPLRGEPIPTLIGLLGEEEEATPAVEDPQFVVDEPATVARGEGPRSGR